MKRSRSKKAAAVRTAAALIAMLMAASAMTGCNDKNKNGNDVSETSSGTLLPSDSDIMEAAEAYNTETRPLEAGDDYAINKINNKSPEDALPGGYKLVGYTEEQQGKFYISDGKSQIIIRAYNYKEDLVDMAAWADNACANITMLNIISYARDTDFGEPENVKVCGFDGIRYESKMTQYQFSETEFDEKGDPLKIEQYHLRGRYYFFYSDQDAYVIMFDTLEENWDEQSAMFEEFVKDLEVTKTEY